MGDIQNTRHFRAVQENQLDVSEVLEQVYDADISGCIKPDIIVTEDSNAGHEMIAYICEQTGITCIAAGGKSNIVKILMRYGRNYRVLAFVDGAAFGADMEGVMKFVQQGNVSVWAPESFEYVLLKTGIVKKEGIKETLEDPGRFIESRQFFSWERYFNKMLENITEGTVYMYNKKHLNESYLTKGNVQKFLQQIPERILL